MFTILWPQQIHLRWLQAPVHMWAYHLSIPVPLGKVHPDRTLELSWIFCRVTWGGSPKVTNQGLYVSTDWWFIQSMCLLKRGSSIRDTSTYSVAKRKEGARGKEEAGEEGDQEKKKSKTSYQNFNKLQTQYLFSNNSEILAFWTSSIMLAQSLQPKIKEHTHWMIKQHSQGLREKW